MKWLLTLFALLQLSFLSAQFSPPPNPPPPPPSPVPGLLPVVLVNDSGLNDNQIFIVVTGRDIATSQQVFVQFDTTTGIGTLVVALPGDNALLHSVTLAQLPSSTPPPSPPSPPGTAHVFYVPPIDSALIFFSIGQALNMPVNPPNNIVQPNFTNPADPNYNTNFDIFEFAFVNTVPNVAADATAVSFFSLPLYGFISTPSLGSASNTGLFQPRDFIISHAQSFFSSAPEASQWNNLILRSGTNVLRILAPAKAMTTVPPLFDPNYLDNAAAYGYSYINDIWTSPTSFYRTHPLTLQIPTNNGLYTGVIQPDNSIVFTSGTNEVIFDPPTTVGETTTIKIFSGLPLFSFDNSGTGDGIQVSKLFEEGIIAGLVPTANTLSNAYLVSNQSNYYMVNPNLSLMGKVTGPWYDLYSKALHSLGTIYTFAFDEPLWPQVLITSDTLTPNTYLGVTIGRIAPVPASNVTLTASANPAQVGQMVTFTATVTGSAGTPTGTVTFIIDGMAVANVPLLNGQASFQTSSLTVGQHTIEAIYSGDVNNLPATSLPITEVITSQEFTSTTTLTSSLNPAQLGQTVVFTATVTGAAETPTPTGTVTFSIDGVVVASEPLVNGQASFQISNLSLGSHTIVASYSGDTNFLPSSDSLVELINIINGVLFPRDLRVRQVKNEFATQTDYINIITWKAPLTGPTPVLYKIYRNRQLTELVASVRAEKHSSSHHERFRFADHNRKPGKTYTYFIVSADQFGNISAPAKVVFHGRRSSQRESSLD